MQLKRIFIAELYYTDGQKAVVPLVDFAMNMKWGP